MVDSGSRLSWPEARRVLGRRLAEPPPGRIQLLTGPRQVGKTTLLLELAGDLGDTAVYAAADGPEASLPGFWERLWQRVEEGAGRHGRAVLLLDEAHVLDDWAARLKGRWDRVRRTRLPVHVVATGSSALRLATASRESLAGRFERTTLGHWDARALSDVFGMDPLAAAEEVVRYGAYPGALEYRGWRPSARAAAARHRAPDEGRWRAYVRDAILEPAIGRDLLALAQVRKPGLLRQVFGVCIASPAQVVSLQKIQGQLQDRGALETVAHYLALLEEAFLVAPLPKFAATAARQRASPPKLVTLSNALLAAGSAAPPSPTDGPADAFGAWVENACLAHAWNAGQRVRYWREEPLEVDAVIDGDWGRWAVEVKTGRFREGDLKGLLEFTRRHSAYTPLLVADEAAGRLADALGIRWTTWQRFLLDGPPMPRAG